jgi:hypothetical protein
MPFLIPIHMARRCRVQKHIKQSVVRPYGFDEHQSRSVVHPYQFEWQSIEFNCIRCESGRVFLESERHVAYV